MVDKTGTLTEGRPRLTTVMPADSISEEELLTMAAAVWNRTANILSRRPSSPAPGSAGSSRPQ